MARFRFVIGVILLLAALPALAACPALLQHEMKKLHSSEIIDLCESFKDKPMVIVNTASHCGFTPQFTALEAMHQRYQDKGVNFLGVSSDSFYQAAASEEQAANVCYVNYGVTFPVTAPVAVRGKNAHPLFQQLAAQSAAPRWNFYKYVVDRKGNVVGRFGSSTKPDDPEIARLLDQLIANQ